MLYISLSGDGSRLGEEFPIRYTYTIFKETIKQLEIDPVVKAIALRADSATIVDNKTIIDRFGRYTDIEMLSPLAKACICIYTFPGTWFGYDTIIREEIMQLLVLPRGRIDFPDKMVKAVWFYEPSECEGAGGIIHQDIQNEICLTARDGVHIFKTVHEVFRYMRQYQSSKGL